MKLQILYRGYLSECNYSCYYCPFSKTINSKEEQQKDRKALKRFVQWVKDNSTKEFTIEILFIPFGEALVRDWYQNAIIELSHLPYVSKVAVQTNLSYELDWLNLCGDSIALWTTFHPHMVSTDDFLTQCEWLRKNGVRHSVGSVGIKDSFTKIAYLREKLHNSIYLWINAYKHEENYYSEEEIKSLCEIDPFFHYNLSAYQTKGSRCNTGSNVVFIDGSGDLYRCNFIKEKRGNIFEDSIKDLLCELPCSNDECHCHIGYIHLNDKPFSQIYNNGLLERIPMNWSYCAK